MPFAEGYFAKIGDYPESDVLICVANSYPWFINQEQVSRLYHGYVLGPMPFILRRYKSGEIDWEYFSKCYLSPLNVNKLAEMELEAYVEFSKNGKTVRLICWERADDGHCRRFLLLDKLRRMENGEPFGAKSETSSEEEGPSSEDCEEEGPAT